MAAWGWFSARPLLGRHREKRTSAAQIDLIRKGNIR
jgi:hypothetical protein